MHSPDANRLGWFKSGYSASQGACTEVATSKSKALVRDSKYPDLGHLTFADNEWSAFLQAVKSDELGR
ncbi:hypothetical protein HNR23_004852 [Nocardiopsis mwathae]|uniref:DUF397 domain-containing protein n=1 Tax=Nocardiopsis mwathae TaxID=1472723 RepID=A0A7W9YMB1_9ACTN|nr:DUF397 domain-containing protein [Nocardiopsis mwathae]MBB6174792.1 hypothetical protein [Nocardiopsis mwathae]